MTQTTDGGHAGAGASAGTGICDGDLPGLVASELAHRLKNIFGVITGLIAVSAKAEPAAAEFAQALIARIGALARAHEQLQPPGPDAAARREQTMQGLLLGLLAPYAIDLPGRITVGGVDAAIGPRSAIALSLIVHEWATNAIKYGALSLPEGRVVIDGRNRGESYELIWHERDGPHLAGAPHHKGIGSDLSDRIAAAQLQTTIIRDWAPHGLTLRLAVPGDLLSE